MLSANTFPGSMELEVNGIKLAAGKDFIVRPFSGGQKGVYRAIKFKKKHFSIPSQVRGDSGRVNGVDGKIACTIVPSFQWKGGGTTISLFRLI